MKNVCCCTLLLGSIVAAAGQGYVDFYNSSTTKVLTNYPGAAPGPTSTDVGSYYYALFAAPTTVTNASVIQDPTLHGWTYVAMATNVASLGRLSGGAAQIGPTGDVRTNFAVAGWSASIGSTWAEAQQWWNDGNPPGSQPGRYGFFGIAPTVATNVFLSSVPGGSGAIFWTEPGTIQGFTLYWQHFYYPISVYDISPWPANVAVGSNLTLTATVSWEGPTDYLTYQWSKDFVPIAGATNSTYTLTSATTNDAGNYRLKVSSPFRSTESNARAVVVYEPVRITTQPASQVLPAGGTASFSVVAEGSSGLTYQWQLNGSALPGATNDTVTVGPVGLANLGGYTVVVSNAYSSAISDVATLQMSPTITVPFTGLTAVSGQSATLSVTAIGSGTLSYQWYRDGTLINEGTNSSLVLATTQIGDAGYYSVVVSSALGSVTNAAAQLVVDVSNVDIGFYAGLTISGIAGHSYEIQYTTDLALTNSWITLTNIVLDHPGQIWVDTGVQAPMVSHRYYRVRTSP
jgi:hypothetical protein